MNYKLQFWSAFERFTFKNLRAIDWCHYQGPSLAPTCIVRHQTLTNAPTSKVSHQSPRSLIDRILSPPQVGSSFAELDIAHVCHTETIKILSE